MVTDDEAGIGRGIVVDADSEDGEAGHLVVQLEQRGQLFEAGCAPAPQKLSRTTCAAIAGQMHGGGAVGDGEVGGGIAGLRRMRAAIAGREKSRGARKIQIRKRGNRTSL